MRIGFPRALYYFDHFPFWAGFFHRLGIEVVTSPATHRQIMEQGLKKASDETCLPLKLLAGHIQALKDVDWIFLPRIVSVEADTYTCPKFLGIPESLLPAVPPGMPVLTVTLNWRKGKRQVLKDLEVLGAQLSQDKADIRKAFNEGLEWQQRYQDTMGAGWNFEESIREIERAAKDLTESAKVPTLVTWKERMFAKMSSTALKPTAELPIVDQNRDRLRIALVGHSYLTHESYANLNLLRKLREKANVELVQNVNQEEVETNLSGLRKKLFWSHSKQIFGAGNKFAEDQSVEGIIYLTCFGCGTDSMVQELVSRRAREQHKPYMVITLDEHSGEAGLVTRLEAFLDMVERRRVHEGYVSTYGECLDRDSNAL
ncbi:acyl-CoA dehydratase activase-related protein [Desulfosporosinus nitroreducens]|uniref:Acyl-CoA dehydratase activase-related protein n=1 Tax=Desulfosporosinus nitroreducens TaxID=2018668 RepID=A0ABT8QNP3_9FIRM|nr:acyl-CoA dehydratase activase-related protein [Desulfosporosinus nitroreducens]MCO1599990.1 acyl-CoA dehydratase activase-related protein [Desulfosporosinus nitroreducens]MDO0822966.1 acyl-CoA dehydratase activase-related protein [Desulfosporosinus nitroreducens]